MGQLSLISNDCSLVASANDSILSIARRRLMNIFHPSLMPHHMIKYASKHIKGVWITLSDTKAVL